MALHIGSQKARDARLQRLSRTFECVWCTGWEERAEEYLPHLLGLPGGWPHLTLGEGWKLEAIDTSYGAQRPLAWIDDVHDDKEAAWAASRQGPTLLVTTDPAVGLTDDHVSGWRPGRTSTPAFRERDRPLEKLERVVLPWGRIATLDRTRAETVVGRAIEAGAPITRAGANRRLRCRNRQRTEPPAEPASLHARSSPAPPQRDGAGANLSSSSCRPRRPCRGPTRCRRTSRPTSRSRR